MICFGSVRCMLHINYDPLQAGPGCNFAHISIGNVRILPIRGNFAALMAETNELGGLDGSPLLAGGGSEEEYTWMSGSMRSINKTVALYS